MYFGLTSPYQYWLSILIVLVNALTGVGQTSPVIFEKFNDEKGLPNNMFRVTIQDRQGRLWMGGGDGVASYDGYTMKNYRHSNSDTASISGNNVGALYEDMKGRIWVSSYGGGLDVSDMSRSAFRRVPLLLSGSTTEIKDVVTQMTQDSSGNFWLIADTTILILQEKPNGSFFCMKFHSDVEDDKGSEALKHPTMLFTAADRRIWIGTATGVCIYDPDQNELTCPPDIAGIPQRNINDIGYDRLGRLWVACANNGPRLFYSVDSTDHFQPFDGIPFESMTSGLSFAFDLDNRIWVSEFTYQLYGYDFRDSTIFLKSKENTNITYERFLRTPFVDHSGNVWIHGEGYKLHRYPKGFNNYIHPFTFHQSCMSIYGDEDQLWFAYREHGLVDYDIGTRESRHFTMQIDADKELPGTHFTEIFKLDDGNYVLVGFGHVDIINDQHQLIQRHIIGGTNRAGMQDSKGRIWIGGIRGLHLFSEREGVLETYILPADVGDPRNFIQAIVEDKDGRIWFGGSQGLAVLEPETDSIQRFLPIPRDVRSIPSRMVLDLALDKSNTLWIATDVALVKFNTSTYEIKSYDRLNGFQSDFISSVICGNDGLIWVATNSGISSLDPVSEGIINYQVEDGLLNRNYYISCRYQSENGTIYFGGEDGVDFFHPSDLRKNPTPPRIFLTGALVNNTCRLNPADIESTNGLDLTYRDDLIEIEFTGIHYAAPEKVRYVYRVDGIHDEWIDLGNQRRILFTDLKADDYTFRAKAISADGVWSEDELVIPMHISPPFYATLWFRILGMCLLAGALFAYIKYREQRVLNKERREAEVARKISELEKRALQAQMNPHFIYNCMNSIQQFMILHDFEGAMKYLTRFSRLLRSVLNMSAQQHIALSDEIKLIEDYLELENMRFPNKFTYDLIVSPEISIHSVEIPPFFIQPQVENAVRHGLLNKGAPGHLTVRIDKDGANLNILVEDDGIGRAASAAAKQTDHIIHESKGLAIVKERLSHLNTGNGIHPMRITDLYDASGKATGTRVEITLPQE